MDPKAAKESIIAQGTAVKGVVSSDCPVTVSGVADGEFTAPALVVTDSGSVNGRIKVEDLRSSGEIAGDIDVGAMQLSGRVRDNTSIRAKTLEVKLASGGSDKLHLIVGSATLEVGPPPPGVRKTTPEERAAD
ncbi:MAG: polymer-forming cytoskeletal protein [Proteobacteria bacterium]|nr:polymer-forming cytoskeletal protein [Pseudomonadota bacterium]